MICSPSDIIAFWFGASTDAAVVAKQQEALWWSKNHAIDTQIKQRFENTLLAAAAHNLDAWSETATGTLALILLTDQMPRNMYRDTPRAFAFDPLARQWCKSGLEQRMDRQLPAIQRVFFYLPLEHSEALDDQRLCLRLFGELADSVAPELRSLFAGYVDFAQRHLAIIERFGRFPHRNLLLSRNSSEAELEFLKQPGSGF